MFFLHKHKRITTIIFFTFLVSQIIADPLMIHIKDKPIQFTEEEKQYISQEKILNVGLNEERKPFSQYRKDTKKFEGINIDVLDEISRKTGLKFNYISQTPGVKVIDLFKSGKYNIICGIERDNFNSNPEIITTKSFLNSSIVPVGKPGKDFDIYDKIIVTFPSSFQALQKTLSRDYPNLIIKTYKTNLECLDAVISDQADLFIQNTHLLSQLLQEPKYNSLTIMPIEIMEEHTAMAIQSSEPEVLISILNKAIENMDNSIITSSLIRHTFASSYKYTFKDFLYKFKVQIGLVLLIIIIIFIFLIFFISIKQKTALKFEHLNKNLEKALVKAEIGSTTKTKFLAQMSHEIRTPMNAIIGLSNIAKTEVKNPEKTTEYLSKIETSSKFLLAILNDILDMSALEGGKIKIDNSPFNFKHLLTNLTSLFYQQASGKKINFSVHMNSVTEETLVGDELRLNQILMNLLSNAIKFTPSGGKITLSIVQSNHSEDKIQFRFIVSDTGCGISDDMQKRLFQPFEQEAPDTAKKHGGSGLGLSITKNLVELMNGSIFVKSVLNEGSSFTVDIPFGCIKSKNENTSVPFKKIHALIIDDNIDSCEYAGLLLSRLKIRYDISTNGEDALNMLSDAKNNNDKFNLCLIDWKMPKMDGIELTKKIRETFGDDAVVIIVSAYDLNEIEISGQTFNANYYITKPLFQSTLFNILMHITNGENFQPEIEKEDPKYDFAGKRILVVEDVFLNMEITAKILKMVNVQVTGAEDGQKALEIFKTSEPNYFDCILMDINMPIMDGYETTKRIRQLNRSDAKKIPIFAMTANAFSEDVTKALNAGMNGHIAKPIETRVLYKTLNSAFFEETENE